MADGSFGRLTARFLAALFPPDNKVLTVQQIEVFESTTGGRGLVGHKRSVGRLLLDRGSIFVRSPNVNPPRKKE